MPDSSATTAEPSNGILLTPAQRELAGILRNIGGPLFAILDASRDPSGILGLLRSSGEEYESLYEGLQGRALEAFAPHLVRITEGTPFLEDLIGRGWAKGWGIFAVSAADFKTLRRHLRTFLKVVDAVGKRLYFRYYDPRVLRVYLPTCNAVEAGLVFGPVAAYLCEGEDPDCLLVFQPGSSSPQCECVPLGRNDAEGLTSSDRLPDEALKSLVSELSA